jgi:hypothetical protein
MFDKDSQPGLVKWMPNPISRAFLVGMVLAWGFGINLTIIVVWYIMIVAVQTSLAMWNQPRVKQDGF